MKDCYRVVLTFDPEGDWIAEHPDLPGCKANGKTEAEAMSALEKSRVLWIESRLAIGLEIPEPKATADFGGKFVIHVSESMHRELALEAEETGQSLNAYVTHVLACRQSNTGHPQGNLHVPLCRCSLCAARISEEVPALPNNNPVIEIAKFKNVKHIRR